VGKPVTILIPPERQDEEPAILVRIRRGERIDHYETIRQRKDGNLINISLTISPVKNAQGEIVGALKIARDGAKAQRPAHRYARSGSRAPNQEHPRNRPGDRKSFAFRYD
jgi:PAS domain S-box-containing protein